MPKIKEQEHVRIKEKSTQEGKEQITKVADEKMVTTKAEAEKTEAPKKKKNIIRVYHAQNASDGGKNRPKRPASDKKPAARPQQRTQAAKPAETVAQKPVAETTAPKKPQSTPVQETPLPLVLLYNTCMYPSCLSSGLFHFWSQYTTLPCKIPYKIAEKLFRLFIHYLL